LEEYVEYLQEIWDSGFITNDGPMFQRFEKELAKFTSHEHLVCLGNGTLALQIAIRALKLKGNVITTPFTHVASSGTLYWENCNPVYCDIDPATFNIDPDKIESLIDENTTAILAVHVYSNPCDMEKIASIAAKHKLKVLYDAAHAFGATYLGKSVFSYGDMSMASFNATKGFHTVEGGALFAKDQDMVASIRRLAYFGMNTGKEIVQKDGMNAKLIEFCAAMGLLNLKYFAQGMENRKARYEQYLGLLDQNDKIKFQKIVGEINYSYMPILCETVDHKKLIVKTLQANGVYPREYFSPSLETVFSDTITCPVAYDVSRRVLCLPMSDYTTEEQVAYICDIIIQA
jgi:dTDP-4-amino-4,6-dideoxygalactose transaminase